MDAGELLTFLPVMSCLAGKWNISDFFTKSLPKEKFDQFTPYLIVELNPNIATQQRNTIVVKKL